MYFKTDDASLCIIIAAAIWNAGDVNVKTNNVDELIFSG